MSEIPSNTVQQNKEINKPTNVSNEKPDEEHILTKPIELIEEKNSQASPADEQKTEPSKTQENPHTEPESTAEKTRYIEETGSGSQPLFTSPNQPTLGSAGDVKTSEFNPQVSEVKGFPSLAESTLLHDNFFNVLNKVRKVIGEIRDTPEETMDTHPYKSSFHESSFRSIRDLRGSFAHLAQKHYLSLTYPEGEFVDYIIDQIRNGELGKTKRYISPRRSLSEMHPHFYPGQTRTDIFSSPGASFGDSGLGWSHRPLDKKRDQFEASRPKVDHLIEGIRGRSQPHRPKGYSSAMSHSHGDYPVPMNMTGDSQFFDPASGKDSSRFMSGPETQAEFQSPNYRVTDTGMIVQGPKESDQRRSAASGDQKALVDPRGNVVGGDNLKNHVRQDGPRSHGEHGKNQVGIGAPSNKPKQQESGSRVQQNVAANEIPRSDQEENEERFEYQEEEEFIQQQPAQYETQTEGIDLPHGGEKSKQAGFDESSRRGPEGGKPGSDFDKFTVPAKATKDKKGEDFDLKKPSPRDVTEVQHLKSMDLPPSRDEEPRTTPKKITASISLVQDTPGSDQGGSQKKKAPKRTSQEHEQGARFSESDSLQQPLPSISSDKAQGEQNKQGVSNLQTSPTKGTKTSPTKKQPQALQISFGIDLSQPTTKKQDEGALKPEEKQPSARKGDAADSLKQTPRKEGDLLKQTPRKEPQATSARDKGSSSAKKPKTGEIDLFTPRQPETQDGSKQDSSRGHPKLTADKKVNEDQPSNRGISLAGATIVPQKGTTDRSSRKDSAYAKESDLLQRGTPKQPTPTTNMFSENPTWFEESKLEQDSINQRDSLNQSPRPEQRSKSSGDSKIKPPADGSRRKQSDQQKADQGLLAAEHGAAGKDQSKRPSGLRGVPKEIQEGEVVEVEIETEEEQQPEEYEEVEVDDEENEDEEYEESDHEQAAANKDKWRARSAVGRPQTHLKQSPGSSKRIAHSSDQRLRKKRHAPEYVPGLHLTRTKYSPHLPKQEDYVKRSRSSDDGDEDVEREHLKKRAISQPGKKQRIPEGKRIYHAGETYTGHTKPKSSKKKKDGKRKKKHHKPKQPKAQVQYEEYEEEEEEQQGGKFDPTLVRVKRQPMQFEERKSLNVEELYQRKKEQAKKRDQLKNIGKLWTFMLAGTRFDRWPSVPCIGSYVNKFEREQLKNKIHYPSYYEESSSVYTSSRESSSRPSESDQMESSEREEFTKAMYLPKDLASSVKFAGQETHHYRKQK